MAKEGPYPIIKITSRPQPPPPPTLTLRIPEDMREALIAAATAEDSSEARLVRLAIKDFLNKRVNG